MARTTTPRTLTGDTNTMATDHTAPNVGVQLYSTKDFLGSRLGDTLNHLAELGYTDVEPYDILGDTAALRAGLDATGLRASTAHAKITELDRDAVVAAAKELGIGTIIVPWVEPRRFSTREGIISFADEINDAAAFAAGHGIRVGYHNHEFEFVSRVDGQVGWELLVENLRPDVVLQLDTYWASVGGADVFELIPRYQDRIRYLHVKNEPPDAEDPVARVDITGRMDEVIGLARPTLELPVVEVVVEHDLFEVLDRNRRFFAEVLAR